MRSIVSKLSWLLLAGGMTGWGAELDLSKLPPVSGKKIVFETDIKPILEASCLRCHGPEKPKSRFRLDNREMALKGGENGVDIQPNNSAQSPLIHFVSGLVEDMQMPPTGKVDPLTKDQISLLRAWIDQGVDWTETPPAKLSVRVTSAFQYFTVSGNEQKFRERLWDHEGFGGGFSDFWMKEKVSNATTFTTEGRLSYDQHDYRFKFSLDKQDTGFVRGGFEQYRKYSDDTGGYFAPFGSPYQLGRDLHLDIGRAWFEAGLNLPHWPKLVLGYEYQFKDGGKSLLEWGGVAGAGRYEAVFPAYKDLHEQTHILKLDASHELFGAQLEDNLRVEFFDERTARTTATQVLGNPGPPTATEVDERYHHWQAANAFRIERQLTDWLLLTGGYLYTHLNGDSFLSPNVLAALGALAAQEPSAILHQDTHVFNFNAAAGPWQGLTFAAGVQSEWMRQDGTGFTIVDDGSPPPLPQLFLGANLNRATVDENFVARYAKIPHTILFAEGHMQQESIHQSEISDEVPDAGFTDFARNTAAASDLKEVRAGFTVSPWQEVSLTSHYKHRIKDSDYNHLLDESPIGVSPAPGYPAFIRARNLDTDEFLAKLTLKPLKWLKTTLSYQNISTDYRTVTDSTPGSTPGGLIDAGKYDAHIYSINTTFTPWSRLYFNTTFSYQDNQTSTAHNGQLVVADYKGQTYNVIGSATYVLNAKTDLNGSYSFSQADYRQNNQAFGLPLGIVYHWHGLQTGVTRRFNKNLSGNLQYAFYLYDEPTANHATDFRAHGVMASLSFRMP